ncbi:DUF2442 domain-containing protein [Sphingomonas sp. MMS24-JH45]
MSRWRNDAGRVPRGWFSFPLLFLRGLSSRAGAYPRHQGGEAELWLYPEVRPAYNRRLTARELRVVEEIAQRRRQEIADAWTHISPEPTEVRFDEDMMWVSLEDGRTIGVPLAWFPRLLAGDEPPRRDFFLSPGGIHWDALDEDIAVATLLSDRWQTPGTRPTPPDLPGAHRAVLHRPYLSSSPNACPSLPRPGSTPQHSSRETRRRLNILNIRARDLSSQP